ncbi:hypothetical protein SLS55_000204 [Diplodia seriata]|uniref:Uncharacterized protein n=1 Tax=Diplodia seriata TaxID=420778 RepID=A0ABR3CTN2_9PEZI
MTTTMTLTYRKKCELKAALKSTVQKMDEVKVLCEKHHHDFLVLTRIWLVSDSLEDEKFKVAHQHACTENMIELQTKFYASVKELIGAGSSSTNEHASERKEVGYGSHPGTFVGACTIIGNDELLYR